MNTRQESQAATATTAAAQGGLTIVYVLHALCRATATWTDVSEDLNSRVPVIRFRDVQLGVQFSLSMDNENAVRTYFDFIL